MSRSYQQSARPHEWVDAIFARPGRMLAVAGLMVLALAVMGAVEVPSKSVPLPAPDSGRIAAVVGGILSKQHYRRQPLDDSVSGKFLDAYLEALDYSHLTLLQSDVDEFRKKYAAALDDRTLSGDVMAAFDIFGRYLERLERRVSVSKGLLKEEYSFTSKDSISRDRSQAPWPSNEAEAITLWRQQIKYELLQERLNNTKAAEIQDTVLKRYDRLLRGAYEEDAESVLQLYLRSLARTYDPHSDYMSPPDFDKFDISMRLSLVGIGAVLSLEDGYATVKELVPGGPADLGKRLQVNDRIVGVAQAEGPVEDVVGMKLEKTVKLIRGEKGTCVRLQVIPSGAADSSVRSEISIIRDEVKLVEAEAKARLIERKDPQGRSHRLGYIDLPSFYAPLEGGLDSKRASQNVKELLDKLKVQGVEGVVLDLRHNGGGSLAEAIDLTGLLIPDGPVVQVKDSRGRVKVMEDEDPEVDFDGPLVVLVSHLSASASEIVAAALQDYGRAVIVGEKSTFGKGTVQKVEELDRFLVEREGGERGAGALKLTTQKFYRISGGSTQYRGVIPDIRFPSVLDDLVADEFYGINEASLRNALPYDEVEPARHKPSQQVTTLLPELSRRSEGRILHEVEFAYVLEDQVLVKKALESKVLSLNEAERRQDKQQTSDREEKRKKERLARVHPPRTVTEIRLHSTPPASAPPPTGPGAGSTPTGPDRTASTPSIPAKPPDYDAELEEGLNVLSDLLELFQKKALIGGSGGAPSIPRHE